MKEQAINMIDNLKGFLTNIQNIASHPYGNGVNIDKTLADLQSFTDELKECVSKIEEVTVSEASQSDVEENK